MMIGTNSRICGLDVRKRKLETEARSVGGGPVLAPTPAASGAVSEAVLDPESEPDPESEDEPGELASAPLLGAALAVADMADGLGAVSSARKAEVDGSSAPEDDG